MDNPRARPAKAVKKVEVAKFGILAGLATIKALPFVITRMWDDLRWSVVPSRRVKRMMWTNRIAGLALGAAIGALATYVVETRVMGRSNGHSGQEQASTMLKDVEKKVARYGREVAERGQQVAESARSTVQQSEGSSSRSGSASSSSGQSATSSGGNDLDYRVDDVLAGMTQRQTESQVADLPNISEGMKVVDFDGVDIGRVKAIESDTFVLSRPKGDDLRVPKNAGLRVEGTILYLRTDANQVHRQGWESVPVD